eukprot:scaffold16904_cov101-Isochrysis_galbana.AAC.4
MGVARSIPTAIRPAMALFIADRAALGPASTGSDRLSSCTAATVKFCPSTDESLSHICCSAGSRSMREVIRPSTVVGSEMSSSDTESTYSPAADRRMLPSCRRERASSIAYSGLPSHRRWMSPASRGGTEPSPRIRSTRVTISSSRSPDSRMMELCSEASTACAPAGRGVFGWSSSTISRSGMSRSNLASRAHELASM